MKNFNEYINEGRFNKSKSKPNYKSFNDIKDKYDINIETINIFSKHLNDLNGIEGYKKLKMLYCSANRITNLELLRNLNDLKHLECDNNQITSLEPLEKLINLKGLYCQYNKIQSFKGLPENITSIICYDNPLNNWQEDIESFIRAYKLSYAEDEKKWFDDQERFAEIIDLIKINMI